MREPIVPQLSADEYLSWESRQPERFEPHEGFIIALAGGLSVHDRVAFNVRTCFERGFADPCRSFGSDLKIKVSVQTFFSADAGVVCEGYDDTLVSVERPRVVADVLSPSTRAYDLVEKRAAYRAMPSVDAYVIVHTTLRRIEVDERRDGAWSTLEAVLTLDDVYARTTVG